MGHTFELSPHSSRVSIVFNESDVSLNCRSLIFDPMTRPFLMIIDITGEEVSDVFLYHSTLVLILSVFQGFSQILIQYLKNRWIVATA